MLPKLIWMHLSQITALLAKHYCYADVADWVLDHTQAVLDPELSTDVVCSMVTCICLHAHG